MQRVTALSCFFFVAMVSCLPPEQVKGMNEFLLCQIGKMTKKPETWKLQFARGSRRGNSHWITYSGFQVSPHTPLLLLAPSVPSPLVCCLESVIWKAQRKYWGYSRISISSAAVMFPSEIPSMVWLKSTDRLLISHSILACFSHFEKWLLGSYDSLKRTGFEESKSLTQTKV